MKEKVNNQIEQKEDTIVAVLVGANIMDKRCKSLIGNSKFNWATNFPIIWRLKTKKSVREYIYNKERIL